MFSIIIPLYNKAAYIEKAIHSVLNQTNREFEIIIVNDGSTDDSLKNLQDTIKNIQIDELNVSGKIKVIDQKNQGVSMARNNGVKVAYYDYIAFLDADDWWEPTYLEEMKALITEFPQAGIYGCSYYKVKNRKCSPAIIGVDNGFESGLINYCQVYVKTLYQPLWTGSTIIKRSVFESLNGFNPGLKLGEDFDLWIRVAMEYPVAFKNKLLAFYNQDVNLAQRAIGLKLYEPHEHMLFTDYGGWMNDIDFRNLYEELALYGLLNYYIAGKNKIEVDSILSGIQLKNHSFKYRLYYQILPKIVVKNLISFLRVGSILKSLLMIALLQFDQFF